MMITSSVAFHPPFVYALEDACVRHKDLKLDPVCVSIASVTSLQQPVGIILLEKQLMQNCSVEVAAKRRKLSKSQKDDLFIWIEVAKLYKSISHYDFVHCIFSGEVSKQENTKLAVEAESRNDFAQALKLYNQVIIRLYLFFYLLCNSLFPLHIIHSLAFSGKSLRLILLYKIILLINIISIDIIKHL